MILIVHMPDQRSNQHCNLLRTSESICVLTTHMHAHMHTCAAVTPAVTCDLLVDTIHIFSAAVSCLWHVANQRLKVQLI